MIIEETAVDGVTVFRLRGDFISEPDQMTLQQKVRDLVRNGKTRLVVDLRDVHYINSCGIGSLVGALTTLRRAGGEIYLAESTKEVRAVFETTQLQQIFQFHPRASDAVRAVDHPTV
ncbi:MAG TPA: STAS domain-containing protein [Bacteroidota bacterium]|nr:STAS domain-containing protein [Bacteroidota bacterium]